MLRIIKKSIVSFLIFSLIFTVGCSKNEKESTNSKTQTSTLESVDSIENSSSAQDDGVAAGSQEGTNTESTTTQSNEVITGENISVEASSNETSSENTSSYKDVPPASSEVSDGDAASLPKTDAAKMQAKTSEEAVSLVLDSVIAGDFEKAKANLITDEVSYSLGFDDYTMNRVKKIFKNLDYKIISSKAITDYEASVTVKISALNFDTIFTSYLKKVIELSRLDGKYTIEQLNKKLDQALNTYLKSNQKVVTKKIKLHVVKSEDGWKVRDSLTFARACLGGADSINSIIQAANEKFY